MGAEISMTVPQMRRRCVGYNGFEVRLSPKHHEIVTVLLLRRGQLVSDAELIDALWPDPDAAPEFELQTLRIHIFNIRKVLPGVIWSSQNRSWIIEKPGVESPQIRLAA